MVSIASNRSDGLWSVDGHEAGSSEGATANAVIPQAALASVGRALQNIFERYSGTVMRRVVGVADESGIDGLYVAFVVMREHTAWPVMRSEDRNALELASRLLNGFAMLPSNTYMQVPPAEVDALVDRVLTSLAQWSRQQLTSHLKREYMGLLEEYAERLRPVLETARGVEIDDELVDRPAITIALMEAFEQWLAEHGALPSRRAMQIILARLFG